MEPREWRLLHFLHLHARGPHSVIQDADGKGAALTMLGPGATAGPSSKGCALHRGARDSRPPGESTQHHDTRQPCCKPLRERGLCSGSTLGPLLARELMLYRHRRAPAPTPWAEVRATHPTCRGLSLGAPMIDTDVPPHFSLFFVCTQWPHWQEAVPGPCCAL